MTTAPKRRHVVRREALESASRPLLLRLLEPHRAELAELDVDLDAPPAARVDKDPLLAPLYKLAVRGGRLPAELETALAAFDTLATPQGVRALREQGLAKDGTLGVSDIALTAVLDHGEAAKLARVRAASESPQRFLELDSGGRAAGRRFDRVVLSKLEASLSKHFAARDDTPYVDVVHVENEDESVLEVTHGSPARTESHVDAATVTRVTMDLRLARRDYVVLHRETGRLAVAARTHGEKLALASHVSDALFAQPDAFSVARTVVLDPLARPAELSLVPGVTSISVAQLTLFDGRTTNKVVDAHGDLSDYLASAKGTLALEGAEIVEAVVYVGVEGRRRPLRVELRPPATLAMDRRDAGHHAVVRRFLEVRGVVLGAVVRGDAVEA